MELRDWDIAAVQGQTEKYKEKVRQFALLPLLENTRTLTGYDDITDCLRRLGVWAIQNPIPLLEAIRTEQPYDVLVGFRPTRYHVGHLTLAKELAWHLEHGATPYVVVSGFEANAPLSNDEARERVSLFWRVVQAFGKDTLKEPEHVYSDTESVNLRLLEDLVAAQVPVQKVFQLYGWKADVSVATLRIATMSVASFLLPQRLHPSQHTVVLSDINQVTHAELTKIAAQKLGVQVPTFSYRMLVPSLLGPGHRMSVRTGASTLFLGEDRDSVATKLLSCFSGGRGTIEEQRLLGGDPQACSFFRSCATILGDERLLDILNDCVLGRSTCRECKTKHHGATSEALAQLDTDAHYTRGGG